MTILTDRSLIRRHLLASSLVPECRIASDIAPYAGKPREGIDVSETEMDADYSDSHLWDCLVNLAYRLDHAHHDDRQKWLEEALILFPDTDDFKLKVVHRLLSVWVAGPGSVDFLGRQELTEDEKCRLLAEARVAIARSHFTVIANDTDAAAFLAEREWREWLNDPPL
jgi:hypothetical protein